MKKCTKCGEEKSENNFYKDKYAKGGSCLQCKKCKDNSNKRDGLKYLEKYKKTAKGKAAMMWVHLRHRVKNQCGAYKGIEVKMSQQEFKKWAIPRIDAFMIQQPNETPSLDRIDPTGHYEINNLRIISKRFNTLRSRLFLGIIGLNKKSKIKEIHEGITFLIEALLDGLGSREKFIFTLGNEEHPTLINCATIQGRPS